VVWCWTAEHSDDLGTPVEPKELLRCSGEDLGSRLQKLGHLRANPRECERTCNQDSFGHKRAQGLLGGTQATYLTLGLIAWTP
jgi:hypothetical protein